MRPVKVYDSAEKAALDVAAGGAGLKFEGIDRPVDSGAKTSGKTSEKHSYSVRNEDEGSSALVGATVNATWDRPKSPEPHA